MVCLERVIMQWKSCFFQDTNLRKESMQNCRIGQPQLTDYPLKRGMIHLLFTFGNAQIRTTKMVDDNSIRLTRISKLYMCEWANQVFPKARPITVRASVVRTAVRHPIGYSLTNSISPMPFAL